MIKKDKMVLAEMRRASEFYLTLNEQGREQYWNMLSALNTPAFLLASNDAVTQQPDIHERPAIVTLEGMAPPAELVPEGKMSIWTEIDELTRRFPTAKRHIVKLHYDHLFPKTGSTAA